MIDLILSNPDRAILLALALLGVASGILEQLGFRRASKITGTIAAGDWGRVRRALRGRR